MSMALEVTTDLTPPDLMTDREHSAAILGISKDCAGNERIKSQRAGSCLKKHIPFEHLPRDVMIKGVSTEIHFSMMLIKKEKLKTGKYLL